MPLPVSAMTVSDADTIAVDLSVDVREPGGGPDASNAARACTAVLSNMTVTATQAPVILPQLHRRTGGPHRGEQQPDRARLGAVDRRVRVLVRDAPVGATLLVALVVPRLAGATPYVVLTGSMQPKMPPGTLVVARPVDPMSIAPGDVVTYQIQLG